MGQFTLKKIKECSRCYWHSHLQCIGIHQQMTPFLPAATKLDQGNIFTSVCKEFCPRGGGGGGCLPQCMLGYTSHLRPGRHPSGSRHPPRPGRPPLEQTHHPPPPGPGRPPLGVDTPPPLPPTRQTPPPDQADQSPRTRHPPPPEADSSTRSTSDRYASYWNAFLFCVDLRDRLPTRRCHFIKWNIVHFAFYN